MLDKKEAPQVSKVQLQLNLPGQESKTDSNQSSGMNSRAGSQPGSRAGSRTGSKASNRSFLKKQQSELVDRLSVNDKAKR